MDISNPRVPYDGDNSLNPMWEFAFVMNENSVYALEMLLDNELSAEILGEINEMIIRNSESEENSDDEDKSNPPSNKGAMIVDATCALSQIKYPQDTELLN